MALSRGLPRVGVTHHLALWSPDLPRRRLREESTTRSPGQPIRVTSVGQTGRCPGTGGARVAAVLGDGYDIRPLEAGDGPVLATAYRRNRDHLAPWDPVRPEAFFTVPGQSAEVANRLAVVAAGHGASWVAVHGEEVVGRVNLNNLVRGVFQSASVGYWVASDHTGRGLATAMVEHAVTQAHALDLHRLEAGTLLANESSQRVLAKAGFERIGVARDYLFIAGRWQDHVLFQRILHADPLPESSGATRR